MLFVYSLKLHFAFEASAISHPRIHYHNLKHFGIQISQSQFPLPLARQSKQSGQTF